MPAFLHSLPPWALEGGLVLLSLAVMALMGLLLRSLYHKLTDASHLD